VLAESSPVRVSRASGTVTGFETGPMALLDPYRPQLNPYSAAQPPPRSTAGPDGVHHVVERLSGWAVGFTASAVKPMLLGRSFRR